jgi:hypothetical protein
MVLLAAVFFVFAAILMPVWNYTIPKLANSVDSTYTTSNTFTDITYTEALVFTLLLEMVFGMRGFTHLLETAEEQLM